VVKSCLQRSCIDPNSVSGLGFDATCSLAVFDIHGKPVSVVPPDFNETPEQVRNVILWLDHRPELETKIINATKHNLLRYVGSTMSIEMEMPKVLWLKRNMPKELFSKCVFYDLADALTHMATGLDSRSFCSTVCKQGYIPVGVDGSVKGWQEDFLKEIGLEELCEDNFKRIGGVDGVVYLSSCSLFH
jgi:FGGY-family pentulose kinase